MNNIYLNTQVVEDKTAWSKARVDVKEILEEMGYKTIFFPRIKGPGGLVRFWKSLSRAVSKGGHIVMEYPFNARKRMWIVSLFSLLKKIPVYGVIHDINDLRFPESKQTSDMHFLRRFDGLVSHNPSMTAWLRKKGYSKPVVNLKVFDYCLRNARSYHEENVSGPLKVLYAGNLSYRKATYVYNTLIGGMNNVELCVYGQYFEQDRVNGSRVNYKGLFDPNTPELTEKYHFGIIWEGTSLDTCDGPFGEYIRYNNPHKFSLYLSLGLPVVVWKEAAIAPFIRENGLGFTIDSVMELDTLTEKISKEQYREYIDNVEKMAGKVRQGHFLKTAIAELVN